MAYGGGTYISQNKVLPGTYINFVSVASASAALSDRGVATMPLELDWGPDGEIFEVTGEDFKKNPMKIFGYLYNADEMKGLRDLFLNARTLYAYKLTSGGEKAGNDYATARYSGVRGNDLKIVIQKNADDEAMLDVSTLLGNVVVDEQTVKSAVDLEDNDYVSFNKEAELAVTASTPLSGGTNGEVTGESHQTYLDKAESYTFNTMGVVTTDDTIKVLYAAYVKRLRDEMGVKFQLVVHDYTDPDYMGVISVKNPATDEKWSKASLVYWVTGAEAGCAVNKSVQNKIYEGEFTVEADYTQNDLKDAIKAGEFTLHRVGSGIRVLDDINTMVTVTDDCGEIFKDNQTVRVIDQIANDVAALFVEKYLGLVPNDASGRISLWSDIVKIHQELENLRAIENFNDSDITVEQGESKKSVVITNAITVINAMSKLYMSVTVA